MVFFTEDIFKQIIDRELSAEIVYEDEWIIAFKDINPKAKTHILIVPKQDELVTGMDVRETNLEIFGRLFLSAKYIADMVDLEGYKLHMNVGEKGGQVVPRVHLHMLSPDYESVL